MKDSLIIYYSPSNGNTRRIANMFKDELDCDIEEITPIEAYKGSYDEIVELGKKEVYNKKERKINPLRSNLANYKNIIIGSPTWWYSYPPTIRYLLNNYDFSNKNIVLFTTNGGYPGHIIDDFKKELTSSNILSYLQVEFDNEGGPNLVSDISIIESFIKQIKNKLEEL